MAWPTADFDAVWQEIARNDFTLLERLVETACQRALVIRERALQQAQEILQNLHREVLTAARYEELVTENRSQLRVIEGIRDCEERRLAALLEHRVQPAKSTNPDGLIDETLVTVFLFLPIGDCVHRTRFVSRRWHNCVSSALYWNSVGILVFRNPIYEPQQDIQRNIRTVAQIRSKQSAAVAQVRIFEITMSRHDPWVQAVIRALAILLGEAPPEDTHSYVTEDRLRRMSDGISVDDTVAENASVVLRTSQLAKKSRHPATKLLQWIEATLTLHSMGARSGILLQLRPSPEPLPGAKALSIQLRRDLAQNEARVRVLQSEVKKIAAKLDELYANFLDQ
eukprot:TRINITY_DN5135_c0_g1_i1.p1 TRINITY_DN5135_c0_g1~~TRINITY_DN5135_c0_g1_i1.p1  ORF type:complete len:346 (+),score=47.65 TRINITY_DN5135_c0_g1_i1:24-1040(+)